MQTFEYFKSFTHKYHMFFWHSFSFFFFFKWKSALLWDGFFDLTTIFTVFSYCSFQTFIFLIFKMRSFMRLSLNFPCYIRYFSSFFIELVARGLLALPKSGIQAPENPVVIVHFLSSKMSTAFWVLSIQHCAKSLYCAKASLFLMLKIRTALNTLQTKSMVPWFASHYTLLWRVSSNIRYLLILVCYLFSFIYAMQHWTLRL